MVTKGAPSALAALAAFTLCVWLIVHFDMVVYSAGIAVTASTVSYRFPRSWCWPGKKKKNE
jgi:hypothetical protein